MAAASSRRIEARETGHGPRDSDKSCRAGPTPARYVSKRYNAVVWQIRGAGFLPAVYALLLAALAPSFGSAETATGAANVPTRMQQSTEPLLTLCWEKEFLCNFDLLQPASEPDAIFVGGGSCLLKLDSAGKTIWRNDVLNFRNTRLLDGGAGKLIAYSEYSTWTEPEGGPDKGLIVWFDSNGTETDDCMTGHRIETLILDHRDPGIAYYSAENTGLIKLNLANKSEELIYECNGYDLYSNLLQLSDGSLCFITKWGLTTLDSAGHHRPNSPAELPTPAAPEHHYLDFASSGPQPSMSFSGAGPDEIYEQNDGRLLITWPFTVVTLVSPGRKTQWIDSVRALGSEPIRIKLGWLVFDPRMRIWQISENGEARIVEQLEEPQGGVFTSFDARMLKLRSGRVMLFCPGTLSQLPNPADPQKKLIAGSDRTVYWLLDASGKLLGQGELPAGRVTPRFQLPDGNIICSTGDNGVSCYALAGE